MRLPFTITEDKVFRERVFQHLIEDRTETAGPPHLHSLWPCVRLGAAQRLLRRQGKRFYSRRKALVFLRGHSIEAGLVTPSTRSSSSPPAVMYQGVWVRPDWFYIDGNPYVFLEVKSTIASSGKMWELVKRGALDLAADGLPFRNYFEQVCCYCVALDIAEAGLVVYFLQGDYAQRRKHCPECGGKGTMAWAKEHGGDLYQECKTCGYKSYAIDLRVYRLAFPPETLAWFKAEVFIRRAEQFRTADGATSFEGLLDAAPPTQCYLCRDCEAGLAVGCEYAQ